MARLALVTDGVVANVVMADDATPDWPGHVPIPDEAGIGWLYADDTFTDPNPPPVIPEDDDVR